MHASNDIEFVLVQKRQIAVTNDAFTADSKYADTKKSIFFKFDGEICRFV